MRFSASLDRNMEEIERPPVLPVGHYIWTVEDWSTEEVGKDPVWDRLTFNCLCKEATEDVDPDELAEYGKYTGKRDRKVFMFNTESEADFARTEFQVRQFLETLGISEGSLGEALAQAKGRQFIGELRQRPDKNDPEVIFTEIGRTAPIE